MSLLSITDTMEGQISCLDYQIKEEEEKLYKIDFFFNKDDKDYISLGFRTWQQSQSLRLWSLY